jgi:putative ABC transport system ATP-binding protein
MSALISEAPPPARPLVRMRSVNYYFGQGETRTQVLFDNNLEVMPGELVIMTGPSGSGKTTLLTLLGGLRTLQEGQIDIWDSRRQDYQTLAGMAEPDLVDIRKSIGFIFQRHNLFDALSAIQNVRMAQQLKPMTNDADERATELLGKLGLGERIHYKPQQLSGGQRQRVAVARALIKSSTASPTRSRSACIPTCRFSRTTARVVPGSKFIRPAR